MPTITIETLRQAAYPGGSSALSLRTDLAPVAGEQALVAPAKYAVGNGSTYVFERRYIDGKPMSTVMMDSRPSSANRLEDALSDAIDDGNPVLASMPHLHITYSHADPVIEFTEFQAPHRAYDAHFRLGTHQETPVTAVPEYVEARNSTPENAAALLALSPDTVLFGGWDSTRRSHQARFAANVVGEIIGVVADQGADPHDVVTRRSGARIDPIAPAYKFTPSTMKQFAELLAKDPQGQTKQGKKASDFVIGAIPPGVTAIDGIATSRIIRSHVISFASLRRLRFGRGRDGDAAIRILLAAIALDLITRSDADLVLRANAHLREAEIPEISIDHRYGDVESLNPLDVSSADSLLQEAYENARHQAGLDWRGQTFEVEGNPDIPGAADATKDE